MTDLTTKCLGSTDQAASWLLHCSGVPLGTGFVVTLGQTTVTGTGVAIASSMLWLDGSGVGIINYASPAAGANRHTIISQATAPRTLTLPDYNLTWPASSPLTYGAFGGTLYPENITVLAASVTTTSLSPIPLTGLAFSPVANGVYDFEAVIPIQTSNTAAIPKISLSGPAETNWCAYTMRVMCSSTGGSGANEFDMTANAWSTIAAPVVSNDTVILAANTTYLLFIKGVFAQTANTPSSALQVNIQSSSSSYAVTAVLGAILRVRRNA